MGQALFLITTMPDLMQQRYVRNLSSLAERFYHNTHNPPTILFWPLEHFLRSKKFRDVMISNFVSNALCVPSGVPQGSHCELLLFNLFINVISQVLHLSEYLFLSKLI